MINREKITALGIALSPLIIACAGSKPNQNASTDPAADSLAQQDGFQEMFQSNSLEGWKGDTSYWHMTGGVLTGEIREDQEPLKNNTFLIWQGGEIGDFELKAQFK